MGMVRGDGEKKKSAFYISWSPHKQKMSFPGKIPGEPEARFDISRGVGEKKYLAIRVPPIPYKQKTSHPGKILGEPSEPYLVRKISAACRYLGQFMPF